MSDYSPIPGFRAIVPAGGAGTRLWPLSRGGAPKFLHDLTGSGRTLIQATWDRLVPLTGPGGVVVVTGAAHGPAVRAQLPDLAEADTLTEPCPRDSMAAIGLAAAVLQQREGAVPAGSFAADHVIRDVPEFHRVIRRAAAAAADGAVVTVGIPASHPSTAFGYIHLDSDGPEEGGARRVLGFTEKPDATTAEAYLARGGYRWNAGMFVFRTDVLLGHLRRLHPDLHDGLVRIAAAWDTPERAETLDALWPGLTKIAIDHAIAEPVAAEGGMACVSGDFGWDDIGDWNSLGDLLAPGPDGARVLHADGPLHAAASPADDGPGAAMCVEAPGALVASGTGRQICVLGLDDVVVVDTPDALLVTTRARAQQVKQIVDRLRAEGRTDLL